MSQRDRSLADVSAGGPSLASVAAGGEPVPPVPTRGGARKEYWKFLVLVVAGFLAGFLAGWDVVDDAAQSDAESPAQQFSHVDRIAAGLVAIHGKGGDGAGLVIDAAGLILTSGQLVGPSDTVSVRLFDGKRLKGRVLVRDVLTGLALVQVPARNLPVVSAGAARHLPPGTSVELAAYELGEGLREGVGFVPAATMQQGGLGVFAVVPGAAHRDLPLGTVVVGDRNRFLGLVTEREVRVDGVWTAVAMDAALDTAVHYWRSAVPPSRISFVGTTITPALVDAYRLSRVSGVLVQDSSSPSRALHPGDIVYEVDDTVPVVTLEDLQTAARDLVPNSVLRLRIRRGKRDTTVFEVVSGACCTGGSSTQVPTAAEPARSPAP